MLLTVNGKIDAFKNQLFALSKAILTKGNDTKLLCKLFLLKVLLGGRLKNWFLTLKEYKRIN